MSIVSELPSCVHALGAVQKSDGSLRPITDCKRPISQSVISYMDTTCSTFSYMKLDSVAEFMLPGCYFAPVDIKSAIRSAHIASADRQYQGFVWN